VRAFDFDRRSAEGRDLASLLAVIEAALDDEGLRLLRSNSTVQPHGVWVGDTFRVIVPDWFIGHGRKGIGA
jgi:hypothetical protein